MSVGLSQTLIERIAGGLKGHLADRGPGHCVRVDDLSVADARAVAAEIEQGAAGFDVHGLANPAPVHRLEIGVDRAIELRNGKMRPLLLLIPAGAGHAASSLDNSFEPLPLIALLKEVSATLENASRPLSSPLWSARSSTSSGALAGSSRGRVSLEL